MCEADRATIRQQCWKTYFGVRAPIAHDTICGVTIQPIRPVVTASNRGSAPHCSHNGSRNRQKTDVTEESWI